MKGLLMTHLHIMHNIVRPTLNDQIEAYGYLFFSETMSDNNY